MTNYFWLVWYRSRTTPGPKHWSLFMTYDTDDQAIGTIYQVRPSKRLFAFRDSLFLFDI